LIEQVAEMKVALILGVLILTAAASAEAAPVHAYLSPAQDMPQAARADTPVDSVRADAARSDSETSATAFSLPVLPPESSEPRQRHWAVRLMLYLLYVIIGLVCVYIIRHYCFTLNRMFGRQRQPYLDIDAAQWPKVTILVPSHNEEYVIADILQALLDVDYERAKLTIIPINDRSEDKTGRIVDEFAGRYPDVIKPFHRMKGKPGKAAALKDATDLVKDDIMLVFDADYIPGKGLIKQLVAPFFDPEVGAVMGRVVPENVELNLLTRLLDLERAGGYQVDQQARMNMSLVPQYGGTVGGVRKNALLSVGGWCEDTLAEDTEATYRLLLGGWKTVYQNRSECYELVPDTWPMRLRQIMRWAEGHNQTMFRYTRRLLFNRRTSFAEKLDGLLLLGVYMMAPILLLGWMLGIVLWYLGEPRSSLIIILLVTSYGTLGNFAIFFEVTAAAHLDGSNERIRLLPFIFLGFLVSLFSVSRAMVAQILPRPRDKELYWHKTEHRNQNRKNNSGATAHRRGE
jgi:cellulose synthase/poly-beta-1,6-N-acetylglucosamine synthase-like glycosyltransferase